MHLDHISHLEPRIAELAKQGMSQRQIAATLQISVATVNRKLHKVMPPVV
ncbi:helix-turn-helix domain-containing protein [Mucilaginibacter robiniae]|uniref:Helix-turn-helix domain-containing protein n=1 Tax=Mucilaginibacter robiniae TaxID=2728022 RepID=A0A7L5DYK2_9SPHI|nr:helix-turn-helix domain-containing protein [Mucilaginibacter robiniae]QJD95119.1 helix-turn-helix domain-containing protein [Mucilaginibacter robiniae]